MAKDQQAFPSDNWIEHFHGMTLRDYFAAKAMQGMILPGSLVHIDEHLKNFCATAYKVADAMLKEREKQL